MKRSDRQPDPTEAHRPLIAPVAGARRWLKPHWHGPLVALIVSRGTRAGAQTPAYRYGWSVTPAFSVP